MDTRWFLVGAVALAACGTDPAPTGVGRAIGGRAIGSVGSCPGGPDQEVVFDDDGLELAVRAAASVPTRETLTCAHVSRIRELDASFLGITRLGGVESLSSLRFLALYGNELTDIGPLAWLPQLEGLSLRSNLLTDIEVLSGLVALEELDVGRNSIAEIGVLVALRELHTLLLSDNLVTDVRALREHTSLTNLNLQGNADLTDIDPLLDNEALGAGTAVRLMGTGVSCTDVAKLEARGVVVLSDCP